jgi:hypothetical protein
MNITFHFTELAVIYCSENKLPVGVIMTENVATRKPRAVPTKTASAAPKKAPVVKAVKPAVPASKPEKKAKKEKKAQGKSKVVRDSFTMPQSDYDRIAELKLACQKAGLHVKKSELLRAGLQALSSMTMPQLERAIVQLVPIKTGRPKKS